MKKKLLEIWVNYKPINFVLLTLRFKNYQPVYFKFVNRKRQKNKNKIKIMYCACIISKIIF